MQKHGKDTRVASRNDTVVYLYSLVRCFWGEDDVNDDGWRQRLLRKSGVCAIAHGRGVCSGKNSVLHLARMCLEDARNRTLHWDCE